MRILTKDGEKRLVVVKSNGIIFDSPAAISAKIDDETGFLTTPVILSRTGVQYYYGFELGLEDRALEKIGVLRSDDEVFHVDSVKSFVNLVVTDDHPSGSVTVDNVKELQKGSVSHVEKDGVHLGGIITITDKDLIQKASEGKLEVSVGYSNNLVPMVGSLDGMDYEFAQTDIQANHLAIVDAGRCGAACKLITDHKGGNLMIKITIDGLEYEVPEQAAQAYAKFVDSVNKRILDAEAETEEEKVKRLAAEKEKDEAQAKLDAAEEEKPSEDQVAEMVADRASLLVQAKTVLGDKFDELTKDCGTCDTKMKAAVVASISPDLDLTGKSKDYVAASFDMAIAKFMKGQSTTDALAADLVKDGKVVTRDSARQGYMKDQLNLEV